MGKQVKKDMIVRVYGRHHVGIVVKPDVNTGFLVITCWRRVNRRA
jgi:hypothetical protein